MSIIISDIHSLKSEIYLSFFYSTPNTKLQVIDSPCSSLITDHWGHHIPESWVLTVQPQRYLWRRKVSFLPSTSSFCLSWQAWLSTGTFSRTRSKSSPPLRSSQFSKLFCFLTMLYPSQISFCALMGGSAYCFWQSVCFFVETSHIYLGQLFLTIQD